MPEARILIVDDTRANLVALQVLLKPVEADVLIAESGQRALLLAAENKENIALILLDVLMPVMDGFEVARLLNENAVLVQAIIAMAHGLRLEVIAEGVETAEQWEYLKSLDCDFVQGYYFGKPMPQADFEDFLMTQLDKPALVRS